tara:strand:- start:342 stop:878 length:537 start_codon:yes stop_codon:yes gene_type:complete
MAILTPTISFSVNSDSSTSNAGPGSVTYTASIADSLTVGLVEQKLLTTSATVVAQLLDGHDVNEGDSGDSAGSDDWTPGDDGCFIFLRNTSTTTGENILIGIVSNVSRNDGTLTGSDGATAPHDTNAGHLADTANTTLRTMTLLPGEFAWFPFDYTGDIYYESVSGTPKLEYFRWDRG